MISVSCGYIFYWVNMNIKVTKLSYKLLNRFFAHWVKSNFGNQKLKKIESC